MTSASLQAALARFASGVVLVSVRAADGAPRSVAATAFNSVSLEPPVVLWCMPTGDLEVMGVRENAACGLSVLSAEQERYVQAVHGPGALPMWDCGDVFGVPLLAGAIANFEVIVTRCTRHGENTLCFADVGRVNYSNRGTGLLRYAGEIGVARRPAVS